MNIAARFAIVLSLAAVAGEAGQAQPAGKAAPRGQRRVLYVSDPSSIANNLYPDLVREQDLRRWVDMNKLGVTLSKGDARATGAIVIDEVEIHVQPCGSE